MKRFIAKSVAIVLACVTIIMFIPGRMVFAAGYVAHTTSADGIEFIKSFEGLEQKAYQDSGGVWTIGWGHTGGVYAGQYVTVAEAQALLESDVHNTENYVNYFFYSHNRYVTQAQFDAVVSFTFNVGTKWMNNTSYNIYKFMSTGNHTDADIQETFGSWVHDSKGNKLPGLVTRRACEANLYLYGVYSRDPDPIIVPTVSFTVDKNYPTPITAYPAATSGTITLYNASLNPYDTSIRNISYKDECTINEVYTNGYCSVTYPTSSGRNTEYAKLSDFITNGVTPYSWSPSQTLTTYTRSNMSTTFGSVFVTDSCKVVGSSGSYIQMIYPISSGGYKLGWVDPTTIIIYEEEERTPVLVPGPVASGILNGKTVVAVAPRKIQFAEKVYISEGDICRLRDFNTTTGYCTVEYPGGGKTDVFADGVEVRTATVAISEFIAYNPNAQCETTTIPDTLHVYPTSSMNDTVGTYTANWSLDTGDEYTTMNQESGKTEVLYWCSRGKHAGYWKLGWCWLNYYSLDLNGYLDNVDNGGLASYGTADIYINGILRASDVNDFYSANGTYPWGSTYRIEDIKPYKGYTYNGVRSGSTSGTLNGNVTTSLNFTKDPVTCNLISISSNPSKTTYLEGESLNTSGLVVMANFSDGSNANVTSSCSISGYSNTPGTKTVTVSYSGKTTAFTVYVKSKSPTSISITKNPNKATYSIGEEVDLTGLTVKATYDNSTSETISDYVVVAEDNVTSTSGTKTITVSYLYNGKAVSADFTITVTEQYVVSYDANGGSGAPDAQTKNENETLTLSSKKPTKSYTITYNANGGSASSSSKTVSATFRNWKASDGTTYNPGGSYTKDESTTLTAQWTNPTAGTLETASRTGYSFDGWYTDVNGGTQVTSTTEIKTNTTVYAHWSIETDATIAVGNVTGAVGKTVSLPITINKNPGVTAIGVTVTYDSTVLKLVGAENGIVMPKNTFMPGGKYESPFMMIWDDSIDDYSDDDTLAVLKFEILSGESGDKSDVGITVMGGKYTYNASLAAVPFNAINGSVTIMNRFPGDVNNDGAVTTMDATLIKRYIVGGYELSAFVEANADVNGDGQITTMDATLIKRYIVGGYGVELV